MFCSVHLRVLILIVSTILLGASQMLAQNPARTSASSTPTQLQDSPQTANGMTIVHLHWGARPGVSRYRLQLARDVAFEDIVFDRVVTGNDHQVTDLEPGKYFWRIAALTATLGEFSSAGAIEVSRQAEQPSVQPDNARTRQPISDSSRVKQAGPNPVVVGGGWRTAVGEINHPVLAHLRSPDKFDLVGINSDGVTFALDSASGVALWSRGRRAQQTNSTQGGPTSIAPLLIKSHSRLDDVVVVSGAMVTKIEGASGRELWRGTLPAAASSGAVISDNRSSEVVIVDNSMQRLLILDGNDGNIIAQIKLAHRVVGAPAIFLDQNTSRMMIAFDNGQIEIRDKAGSVIRSGDAGSAVTTAPLFVSGSPAGLVLVGTKSGLTALSADDLRALGRVVIKDDAPRGTLTAADLDADGRVEVIMITERGRVVAVNTADGKILWDAAGGDDAESVALAYVDGDRVLDVVVAGGQTFAMALSGRDGSIVWKDNVEPGYVANHAASLAPRTIVALPFGSGALLISGEPSRMGLRAIELSMGTVRPNGR